MKCVCVCVAEVDEARTRRVSKMSHDDHLKYMPGRSVLSFFTNAFIGLAPRMLVFLLSETSLSCISQGTIASQCEHCWVHNGLPGRPVGEFRYNFCCGLSSHEFVSVVPNTGVRMDQYTH